MKSVWNEDRVKIKANEQTKKEQASKQNKRNERIHAHKPLNARDCSVCIIWVRMRVNNSKYAGK